MTRVALRVDPSNHAHQSAFSAMDHIAGTLGVQLKRVDAAGDLRLATEPTASDSAAAPG
jgi:hypothetical protein